MAQITAVQECICGVQGAVYRLAAERGCNMSRFSEFYLKSAFCRDEMDRPHSRYHDTTAEQCWEAVRAEMGDRLPDGGPGRRSDPESAGRIGSMYRQAAFITGLTSSELADAMPFEAMQAELPGLAGAGCGEAGTALAGIIMDAISWRRRRFTA